MQAVTRRGLLGAAAAGAAPWLRADVVVYCDPTLKPVLRAVAGRFTARVLVFAAPPELSLRLLAHGTQDDLLVTGAQATAQAAASRLLADGPVPAVQWRNHLVLAAARGDAAALASWDPAAVLARLGGGRFALSDASPAATIDGPAIVAALGLGDALAGRIVPAAGTEEIGFLIRTGAARLGLCHRTDVRVDRGMTEVACLPAASYAPIGYCVSRTRHAWSANMAAFETFLVSPASVATLSGLGLVRA